MRLVGEHTLLYLLPLCQYEYDAKMEDSFRASLLKSFRKQIDDGYFSFIIVDSVNHRHSHYQGFYTYAKQKGFEVRPSGMSRWLRDVLVLSEPRK